MLSLQAVAKEYAGSLGPLVIAERFPNLERIAFVRSPLLIIHGEKDNLIPVHHGATLFKAARSRKLLVRPPDMGHNVDLFTNINYLVVPMLRFFPLPDYCFQEVKIPGWVYHPTEAGEISCGGDEVDDPDGPDKEAYIAPPEPTQVIPVTVRSTSPPRQPVVKSLPQRQERTASRNMLQGVGIRGPEAAKPEPRERSATPRDRGRPGPSKKPSDLQP